MIVQDILQILRSMRAEVERLPPPQRDDLSASLEKLSILLHPLSDTGQLRTIFLEPDTIYNVLSTSVVSGFILCDARGHILDCNDFAAQQFGYTVEQMIGRSMSDPAWGCLQEDGTPVQSPQEHPITRLLANGELQGNYTLGYHRPDGTLKWVYMNVRPIFSQDKSRPDGIVIKFLDITGYRQTLDALRQTEAQQRELINANLDGILLVDMKGHVRFVNPAAEQIMGRPASALLGEHFDHPLTGQDRTEINILSAGHPRTVEMRVVNLEWEHEPMHLVTLHDITDRKQIEQELRKTADELASRNQELDAFNHTIAHGLKNPLASVLGFSSLIRQQFGGSMPPDVLYCLDQIDESVNDMTAMIDNLLYLAQLRDARQVLEPVDVQIVVKKALRRFERQIQRQHITITIAPNLPAALGHETWLEEVFANFISNAIKYMGKNNPDPQIRIGGTKNNGMIRYWVQDTGIGINPENQANIFEKFARIEKSVEGTGLGLSITRRIINKLGGEVGVDSEPGKGSTFWFTLPNTQTTSRT